MPTAISSPGVYPVELDYSAYVPRYGTTSVGMVGTASKGPTNQRTFISDERQLVDTFGPPSTTHIQLASAIRYLKQGNQLYFVRVATYDASAIGYLRDGGDAANAVTVQPLSSGAWANSISLVVSAGVAASTYKIVVRYGGVVVEVYDYLKVGAASAADRNYIETRINGLSRYITVTDSGLYTTLLAATVALTGGDDGAPATVSDYIGSAGTPPTVPATGLQLFRNPEDVLVSMLAIPGKAEASVLAELIAIAKERGDCVSLLDVPYGKTVQQAVDWHNGLGGGSDDPTSALDSSFAALYYPWIKVYDGYIQAEIWLPPSGFLAGVFAYNDYVASCFEAPAGYTRGGIAGALDLEYSPTQGERDLMYDYGNAINPIINPKNTGRGITVWGQRTLQRAATALDRLNVRRMLNYLKRGIVAAAQGVVFEPNDSGSWKRFIALVTPTLEEVRRGRGITSYVVVCDESTNPAAVINNNEMVANIIIQPTKTAEKIIIQFSLTATGISFSEILV